MPATTYCDKFIVTSQLQTTEKNFLKKIGNNV